MRLTFVENLLHVMAMPYAYKTQEVVADAVVHGMGLAAALIGITLLAIHALPAQSVDQIAALGLYATFLFLALLASAAYHLLPWEQPRPLLHRLDHAAIYFKIAGTYTPFVALIGTAFSYTVLVFIWTVALFGAIAKLSFWPTNARGSLALYLALGWASLLLIGPMINTLPTVSLTFVISGGLLYTLGTVFFAWQDLPYQNAIWHGFVLTASTCFFLAITLALPGHQVLS